MCEGWCISSLEFGLLSLNVEQKQVGRETGLEPATNGITIPPQLRCLHLAIAVRRGDSCFFN
jgi:hypothetical protein